MKILYEKGDAIFTKSDFGGEVLQIITLRKTGVVVQDRFGETSFHTFKQICPTFAQLSKATILMENN